MQWVPGPRRPRRKTTGIRDWGRVWSPTLKMVSTRAAPPSQPGSTSFAPTTQRQPSRHPPALPTGTPAQPPNASATAQAHDHKASATSLGDRGFDSGRSFLAARLNQLWRVRLPRHIRADSINSMENGHKNRGFCPPFGHFLKSTPPRPRRRP